MYTIVIYIPKTHAEIVKEALFAVGAGKYNNYDCCSFEVEGTGQFRPLHNAHPYIGKINTIEKVAEVRVEMICPDHLIKQLIKILREVHPYEEPAFHYYPIFME